MQIAGQMISNEMDQDDMQQDEMVENMLQQMNNEMIAEIGGEMNMGNNLM